MEFVGIRWPEEGWKLLRVGMPEAQAWQDLMIKEEVAPKTRNLRVCSLNNLFTFMRETAAELRLPITVPNPAHRMFLRRENADPVDETEALSVEQSRQVLSAIDTSHVVGLRDRAIIAILIYTAARVGAVAKLRLEDYSP